MSVGILIITHEGIGDALVKTAATTFGTRFEQLDKLCIPLDSSPEEYLTKAIAIGRRLDSGDGVLLLGDLFGATPSNIAIKTTDALENAQLVCGINLPMLLRVINYRHLNLDELAKVAVQGGKSGITLYPNCQKS